MPSSTRLNHRARGLILDFALGAAIVALLPIPYAIFLKLIVLPVLMVLMVKRLLRLWQDYQPDTLARLSLLVSLAGALLLGILGWFGGIALRAAVPWLAGLAPGFAFFALFWGVGQAINHCYLSGLPKAPMESSLRVKQDEA
jgi:uncharacterized protein (DUF697 family)